MKCSEKVNTSSEAYSTSELGVKFHLHYKDSKEFLQKLKERKKPAFAGLIQIKKSGVETQGFSTPSKVLGNHFRRRSHD
jgi:hypothetical protein